MLVMILCSLCMYHHFDICLAELDMDCSGEEQLDNWDFQLCYLDTNRCKQEDLHLLEYMLHRLDMSQCHKHLVRQWLVQLLLTLFLRIMLHLSEVSYQDIDRRKGFLFEHMEMYHRLVD